MINFKPESTCHFGKDSKTSKDENCVDNFAAKLTNRDLCLHDLNITLRIPLFNKIPLHPLRCHCVLPLRIRNFIIYTFIIMTGFKEEVNPICVTSAP